jgi:hypothetical protein
MNTTHHEPSPCPDAAPAAPPDYLEVNACQPRGLRPLDTATLARHATAGLELWEQHERSAPDASSTPAPDRHEHFADADDGTRDRLVGGPGRQISDSGRAGPVPSTRRATPQT